MNRLYQLKETLLLNILANLSYKNLEFVVLDYNSQDGMDEWIQSNFIKYINDGKLNYYKTFRPEVFSHSHAKNLAFKLATGDIVCNINADHFIGEDFAFYLNDKFNEDRNIVITPISRYWSDGYSAPKDVFGKVCVKKTDFIRVQGFDERMRTYGFEDFDFINRLEMAGVRRVILNAPQFLKYLPHTEARFTLSDHYRSLDKILIQYINHYSSNLILLYTNGSFEMGKLIDAIYLNAHDFKASYVKQEIWFEYLIEKQLWMTGRYYLNFNTDAISFFPTLGEEFNLHSTPDFYTAILQGRPVKFYELVDENAKAQILDFHYLFKNRSLLELNIELQNTQPNEGVFGQDIVFKNFSAAAMIEVK